MEEFKHVESAETRADGGAGSVDDCATHNNGAGIASSGSEFERQVGMPMLVSGGLSVLLILGYLSMVLQLTSEQWSLLGQIVALAFPVLIGPCFVRNWRFSRPIRAWLDTAGDEEADSQRAYAALFALPRHLFIQGVSAWVISAAVVAFFAWIIGGFDAYSCAAVVVAGVAGGFVNSVFLCFSVQHSQRALLSVIAGHVGDDRRADISPVSLRAKLLIGVGGVTLAATGFAACLAVGAANVPLEQNAVRVMASSLACELKVLPEPGAADFVALRERFQAMGVASEIVVVDAQAGEVVWGNPGVLGPAELESIQGESGDSTDLASPNVFAWSSIGGTRVVVTSTPWDSVRGDASEMRAQFVLVFLIAAVMALMVVHLIARDFGTSVASITDSVQSVARGDLRRRLPVETEDELGELGAACDSMAVRLRQAVAGVVETVDALESQAALISNDAMEVATGAGEQMRGVHGVKSGVDAVRDQAAAIGERTEQLDDSVDDASSGVAEISASSRALDEMAEAFGVRINGTSSSVEELVRSVRAVSENSAELSGAANDTAARMRSMAAGMQQVDGSAAEGVELSERAVATAEEGRLRVRETVEEMESIRGATDTASTVMQGLVERVGEIDSILDVIDDVAEETNLLALNAAIIAAQAGEHGRAFSVVADEIKELADRVLSSTKEIAGVVHAVQSESVNAARAIEESASTVSVGLERSQQADLALGEITRTSREAGARIEEIVASVRIQSRDTENVLSLMQRVSDGSASIEAAMGEQSRGNQFILDAAIGMRELAEQLKSTTASQATGVSSVLGHIEGVGSSVGGIVQSLQEQIAACGSVAESLKPVSSGTTSHEATAQRLGAATNALRDQANRLRDDVARFVLE